MSTRLAGQVGKVLAGRYRVIAPIGSGASAHVFLADDVRLRRRVAIKVLHAALANDPAFLRRFEAEAQAVAALNHPNVMRVFDWGEGEEGPFLVLEYLGGGSLRDMLDTGVRLTPEQALLAGLEAARALDYAHRRGLVHRDIKPANLLFDEDGRLRVADFGIARALAEAAWTEPAGAVLGTARYASPEQVQGSTIDGKADVFALSLVLMEAVTGRVPFSADTTIATLMARVNTTLEVPEELGPLGPVIEEAAKVNPEDRLDAAMLAAKLEEVARELPAPERLQLAGVRVGEQTVAVDRDSTMLGQRPRVADFVTDRDEFSNAHNGSDVEVVYEPDTVFVRDTWRERRQERRRMAEAPMEKNEHYKLILSIAGMAAVLAVLAGLALPLLRPQHPVPALIGKPLSEARQIADQLNVDLFTDDTRYSDRPFGYIIDQDPPDGKIREGSAIGLVVSQGPAPREVPNLRGMDEAEARAALKAKGFDFERRGRRVEDQPKGAVLDWSPRGDQPKGEEIRVVVSDGPPLRTVPDVAGESRSSAQREIEAVDLKVSFAEAFSDTVTAGRVISTDPGSGAKAERDSTVTVTISKGPDMVRVPNPTGLGGSSARSRLEAAGLRLGEVFGRRGTVFASTPDSGTRVRRGTTVDIYVR